MRFTRYSNKKPKTTRVCLSREAICMHRTCNSADVGFGLRLRAHPRTLDPPCHGRHGRHPVQAKSRIFRKTYTALVLLPFGGLVGTDVARSPVFNATARP